VAIQNTLDAGIAVLLAFYATILDW
jgi:hypothetical protein